MAASRPPGSHRGCFVTGTDTGVGKTQVVLGLMRALREQAWIVAGMKPIASGALRGPAGLRGEDAVLILENASQPLPYALVNPYCFEPAAAPHLAAREAGIEVSIDAILESCEALAREAQFVVVEGIGGWRVPINGHQRVSELACRLGYPVVLVVGLRLGCINHALLTAEAIAADGPAFAGWIGNQIDPAYPRVPETLAAIGTYLAAPMLGYVPWLDEPNAERIAPYLKSAAAGWDQRICLEG